MNRSMKQRATELKANGMTAKAAYEQAKAEHKVRKEAPVAKGLLTRLLGR